MSAPNPFDLYEMVTGRPIVPPPTPTPVGEGVCPTCGKTFKQLAQHITKSHTKYAVRIVGNRAYMSFNGGPEVEGDMPFVDDKDDEFQFYPDGTAGVETIGLLRNKKSGKITVYRSGKDGKKMYLHNVKVTV
jgi:hypothetical protein